jgi:hypothetical protein
MNNQFVVLTPKERDRVYKDLAQSKRPIQIQIRGDELKQAKAHERDAGDFYFKIPFIQRFDGEHEAVVTFSLPPDVFFLKTTVRHAGGAYCFIETADVYRLQRRDNFRLMMPERADASVQFKGMPISYPIRDLSVGGFSITLRSSEKTLFEKGAKTLVKITVGDEVFDRLNVERRHLRKDLTESERYIVGFMFEELNKRDEAKLFRIVTDVARLNFHR